MSYCTNCGSQIADNAKFCHKCGATNLNFANQSNSNQRREEYVGKVLKCPACGAEISAINAICPSCGHEINSTSVDPILKKFIDDINKCDEAIANEKEKPKKGWKTWSGGKKFWWVVLNIVTSGVPLLFYLLFPFIKPLILPKSIPELSANEKKKQTLIENSTFPNERQIFVELMVFIKSKIAFIFSDKFNRKTLFWTNTWYTKAEQLKQRANISLGKDDSVESNYNDIENEKKKIIKSVCVRAIIAIVLFISYLVFVILNGSVFCFIMKFIPGLNSISAKYVWLDSGLSTEIPKFEGKYGTLLENNENEFELELDNVSYNEFINYISLCKNEGYSVDANNDTKEYTAYNNEGYMVNISYYSDSMRIELYAPLYGDADFQLPKNDLASKLPITNYSGKINLDTEDELSFTLYQVSEDDMKQYFDDCKAKGFTIDLEQYDTTLEAFNSEGYKINIYYHEMKNMDVTVERPKTYKKISWPSTGPAKLLPKPSSDIGEISNDYDWCFSVYISNMTLEDFNDYVDKCIDKGFEKKRRDDRYFSAEKGDNINLTVEYSGYKTIHIDIDDDNNW